MGLGYIMEPLNQSVHRLPSLSSMFLCIGSVGEFFCDWAR